MSANMESMYTTFVRQRHDIWEGRKEGRPGPWTNNLVLSGKKFTNVFRILDPGTQFICEVMDGADDARHAAFLAHLYRHTGVEEAWRFWQDWRGRWPHYSDSLDWLLEPFRAYRDTMGGRLFTSAYNVFPQTTEKGSEKILSIVSMSKAFWENERPESGASRFLEETSLRGRVEALQQPGVGAFMSMQIATDFGYSGWVSEDLENEWILAGPGARAGIARLERTGESPEETIRWAQKHLWEWADCPTIPLPGGRERAPSLMDVQNTFCEFGKYVRALWAPIPKVGELYVPKTEVRGHGGFHYVPHTW